MLVDASTWSTFARHWGIVIEITVRDGRRFGRERAAPPARTLARTRGSGPPMMPCAQMTDQPWRGSSAAA